MKFYRQQRALSLVLLLASAKGEIKNFTFHGTISEVTDQGFEKPNKKLPIPKLQDQKPICAPFVRSSDLEVGV